MADREKVIRALHCCAHTDGTNCVYCPYDNADEDCTALMSMDVLALLKEQEAVEPIVDSFLNRRCPKCNAVLKGKFCFECGQAVTWND